MRPLAGCPVYAPLEQQESTQAGQVGVHGGLEVGGIAGEWYFFKTVARPLAKLPGCVVVPVNERHLAQNLPNSAEKHIVRRGD